MLYLPNVICIFVNYVTSECIVIYCFNYYCVLFSSMFICYAMYRHHFLLIPLYMYTYVCKSIAHKQLSSHVIDFLSALSIPQDGYLTKYHSNG